MSYTSMKTCAYLTCVHNLLDSAMFDGGIDILPPLKREAFASFSS